MNIHEILFGSRPKSILKIIKEGDLEELKNFITMAEILMKNIMILACFILL